MTTTIAPATANRTTQDPASLRHRRIIVWASAGAVLVAVAAGTAGYLGLRSDEPSEAVVVSQPTTVSGAAGFGADTGALVGHGTTIVPPAQTSIALQGAGSATGAIVGHGGSLVGG